MHLIIALWGLKALRNKGHWSVTKERRKLLSASTFYLVYMRAYAPTLSVLHSHLHCKITKASTYSTQIVVVTPTMIIQAPRKARIQSVGHLPYVRRLCSAATLPSRGLYQRLTE
jgi:hypothetical protein